MSMKFSNRYSGGKQFADSLRRSEPVILTSINQMLRKIGSIFRPVLKANTPHKTGKLRNSTTFQVLGHAGDQRLEVRQNARTPAGKFYGHLVREGTRPHIIRPKNAKALRFQIGNKIVFAKQVRHPGTQPNRYHIRAYDQVRGEVNKLMRELGASLVTTLSGRRP